jgi:SAM-dependent methyltransferase
MKHSAQAKKQVNRFGASPLVRRFASRIADAANGAPILDVGCGSGRNAMMLAEFGCTVICADIDLTRLRTMLSSRVSNSCPSSRLRLHSIDFINDRWPFGAGTLGGILNVHLLLPTLFPRFAQSLTPGGYLLIESIPGHGGNYLSLPAPGSVMSALASAFDFELYKERNAGPIGSDAVTVKVIARRAS